MIVEFKGEPKQEGESWADYLKRARVDTFNALKLSAILLIAVVIAVSALQGLLSLIAG